MEAHSIGILSDRTRVRHPESHAHRQDDAAGDDLRCIPCLPASRAWKFHGPRTFGPPLRDSPGGSCDAGTAAVHRARAAV